MKKRLAIGLILFAGLIPSFLFAQVKSYIGVVRQQYYSEYVDMFKKMSKELKDEGYNTYSKSIDGYLEGGFGSGFVWVAKDGTNYVITNRHVVAQAETASVEFEDDATGEITKYEGLKVIATDDDIDIAILAFKDGEKPFKKGLELSQKALTDGQEVWSAEAGRARVEGAQADLLHRLLGHAGVCPECLRVAAILPLHRASGRGGSGHRQHRAEHLRSAVRLLGGLRLHGGDAGEQHHRRGPSRRRDAGDPAGAGALRRDDGAAAGCLRHFPALDYQPVYRYPFADPGFRPDAAGDVCGLPAYLAVECLPAVRGGNRKYARLPAHRCRGPVHLCRLLHRHHRHPEIQRGRVLDGRRRLCAVHLDPVRGVHPQKKMER